MPGVGIVDLSYAPRDALALFSRVHQIDHNRVSDATGTPRIILDPMNLKSQQSRKTFLLDHYLAHQRVNAFLGTTGPDLSEVDFDEETDFAAWVDLNYLDHQSWQSLLPPK